MSMDEIKATSEQLFTTSANIKSVFQFLFVIVCFTVIVAVEGFWWTIWTLFPPAGFYFGVETFLKFFGVI
jgi:fatty acid desaturase